MKIYLAGNTIVPERERRMIALMLQRLHSYFYIRSDGLEEKSFKEFLKCQNQA